jgi:O-methyltransferase domain
VLFADVSNAGGRKITQVCFTPAPIARPACGTVSTAAPSQVGPTTVSITLNDGTKLTKTFTVRAPATKVGGPRAVPATITCQDLTLFGNYDQRRHRSRDDPPRRARRPLQPHRAGQDLHVGLRHEPRRLRERALRAAGPRVGPIRCGSIGRHGRQPVGDPAAPGQRLPGVAGDPRRRDARVADRLADGPRTSEELAAAVGAHAPTLYRLLRALAAVGVLYEEDGRRFALTPVGECLHSDADEPVGGWAAMIGRPYVWQAWGALLHSVRTGESAFEHVHGVDPWTYRTRDPDEGAIFDRAMADLTRRAHRATLAALDFSRFGTVVNVGGGNGALLVALLRAHARCAACCSTCHTPSRWPSARSRRRG